MNITAEDRDIMRDPHGITTTTPPSDAAIAKDAARLIEMAMHSWREIHAHIEEMEKTGPDGLRGVTAAVSVIDLFNWNSVLAALASYVRRAAAPPAEAPAERGETHFWLIERACAAAIGGSEWAAMHSVSKAAARNRLHAVLAAAPAAPAPDTAGEELTDYLGAALQLESLLLDQTSNYAERAIKHAAVALRIAHDKRSAVHSELPDDVMRALDRMCTPVEGSWLPRATAEADARSMKIIRDYILSAPRVTGGREVDHE